MSVSATAPSPHVFQTNDHLSVDIGWEAPQAKATTPTKEIGMFAEEEPSFWDFLDVVNPLQHIPVVNTIYRELTGDQIGIGARLAGGALFGGPIGFAAAAVNSAIEQDTGKDIGGHLMALFDDEAVPSQEPGAQVAAIEDAVAPPPAPQAAEAAPAPAAALEEPATMPAPLAAMPVRNAMMFTADGPVTAAMTEPPARPLPLAAKAEPARFFPVPPRAMGIARQAPAPVSVPISNSGNRSNVPITGRDPVSTMVGNPIAAQKALADQGQTDPRSHGQASGEWFGSAMKAGLDKYEQAARLGRRSGDGEAVPLQ